MTAPVSRFWMICRKPTHPHAKTEPRARYSTREAARDEAAKLARHTAHPFLVLEVVDEVGASDARTPTFDF